MAAPTETQILQILGIFGVSASKKFYKLDEYGLNTTQFAQGNAMSAVDAIRSIVAGLSTEAANEVSRLVDDYQGLLPLKGIGISQGSVGSISGISFSPTDMLENIKGQLQTYVPFISNWSELPVGTGANHGGGGIGIRILV